MPVALSHPLPLSQCLRFSLQCLIITELTSSPSLPLPPSLLPPLQKVSEEKGLTLKAPFLQEEEFGHFFKAFCAGKVDASIPALYAFQAAVDEAKWPKNVLAGIFTAAYNDDLIEEEAFYAWKEDSATPSSNKDKALVQTAPFFTMLEASSEEEDEDDSDNDSVEEALKDVIRPNNANKLH